MNYHSSLVKRRQLLDQLFRMQTALVLRRPQVNRKQNVEVRTTQSIHPPHQKAVIYTNETIEATETTTTTKTSTQSTLGAFFFLFLLKECITHR